MKIIHREESFYIVRFDTGEPWPDAFLGFCKKYNITGAFFYGIGGCSDPEIAYYDLQSQRYISKKFAGIYEVLNITGNIAVKREIARKRKQKNTNGYRAFVAHTHVTLGNKHYAATGGHLVSMIIGGTLELCVQKIDSTIERRKDKETGLNLFNSDER